MLISSMKQNDLINSTLRLVLLATLVTVSLGVLTPSFALPGRSTATEERGMMMIDSPLPWVAGWDLQSEATNVMAILEQLKGQKAKGVYLLLCATWSPLCKESLTVIQQQSGRLQAEDIYVIAVFLEQSKPTKIQQWLDKLGISNHTTIKVLIDHYHRSAIRLGAYEELTENVDVKSVPSKDDLPHSASLTERRQVKRLRVPLGVVLSMSGRVLSIVTQEGADLIDHISKAIRYAGE